MLGTFLSVLPMNSGSTSTMLLIGLPTTQPGQQLVRSISCRTHPAQAGEMMELSGDGSLRRLPRSIRPAWDTSLFPKPVASRLKRTRISIGLWLSSWGQRRFRIRG